MLSYTGTLRENASDDGFRVHDYGSGNKGRFQLNLDTEDGRIMVGMTKAQALSLLAELSDVVENSIGD